MNKEYFSHDYGTRNDPDLIPILEEFKAAGYGIYWATIEFLHEKKGSLPLTENTFRAIGKPICASIKLVESVIKKLLECGQFFEKNGEFSNNRTIKNLTTRQEIRQKKVNAGKASAAQRQQVFNTRSTPVEQNPTRVEHCSTNKKKSKSKEKEKEKVNTTTVVVGSDEPFYEMFRRVAGSHIGDTELLTEIAKFRNRYPNSHPNQAGALVNAWVANIGKQETKSEKKQMVY